MTDSSGPRNSDLIDGLRRFQDDFEKDLSLRDIQEELSRVLKRSEFQDIITEGDSKIDRLFFVFIYIKENVPELLSCLQDSYDWLYNSILRSKDDKWITDYRKAVQDLPNNQDQNIHRTKYLWEIQQSLKKLEREKYLILFGKLGFGKRWLAADACRDYSVISKMNFKIFWLNVSKCCTQELILEKMHRLKVLLQADDLDIKYNTYSGNTKNEIIHMRTYLRKILEQREFRDCLIVLIDVQDEQILKAFDLKCKMFITTRHIEKFDIIPSDSKKTIEIDKGFTIDESKKLFARAFKNRIPAVMVPYVEQFHDICNGHPFVLSLVTKNFQNFPETDKSLQNRCEKWLKNLGEYKLHHNDDQIKMSMEESLKFLEVYHRKCYSKMVIFTDNSDIPFNVLEKLWDVDSVVTEEIVVKLHKYSLIEKPTGEGDNKACSLHYLHFHFLKQYVSNEDQVMYHRHLIEKYEVHKVLRERKELDLEFIDDNYFHYFIPYHIKGAGMIELFDIYLDFGFLEQKMRFTKLPNTVGDLIRFENEITRNNSSKQKLLTHLIEFLTKSEAVIYKSEDVNLLQCALTSTGLVQKEAQNQSEKFRDRVWMDDVNHDDNQTQIVQITASSSPQIVRFVKPYDSLVCLITLQDNNILLHDISQDYSENPVLFKNDFKSKITELQVFRSQAFLTLSESGKLSVFTLKSSPTRRVSMPTRALKNLEDSSDKLLQKLEGTNDKFTCFNVFDTPSTLRPKFDLFVGTQQGNIRFYEWKTNKFEENRSIMLKTGFTGLFRMAHIHDYVLLLNNDGDLRFTSLINHSQMYSKNPWTKVDSPVNLHQGHCIHAMIPVSLCVSKDRVVQINHEREKKFPNFIQADYEDVFVANDDFADNEILSSTMSKDAEYLILGTTRGIIVIDRFNKKVIFRRNISDQVLSLDIYRYQDEAMYILSSVFKQSDMVINLYGFNGARDEWAMGLNNGLDLLEGEDLFDIKMTNDEWQMVAVDSKNHIHFRNCAKNFTESTEIFKFEYQIKKICFNEDQLIVGCTNGSVYSRDMENTIPIIDLQSEITYLEKIDDKVIASCNMSFKIAGVDEEFMGKVIKAYRLETNQLLLVKKNCKIELLNISNYEIENSKSLVDDEDSCLAQAYHDNLVVIATADSHIRAWKINESEVSKIKPTSKEPVSALAISADKNVLAIGFHNGLIEIYDLVNMTSLRTLESHKRQITNLYFSPWSEPNDPLILLSVSESIVFWDIRSVQNNPGMKKTVTNNNKFRVSARFRSPMKIISAADELLRPTRNLSITEANPWRKKTGSSEKPELLSCIKFVAKSARKVIFNRDFTRFVTIDNEGNIYHLRLRCESIDNELTYDFNGNPMQSIQ